ncbi:hypothetical protein TNCV_2017891 [Trichonephila clavipes]|nr:hypothetical protein TNCV_2017891 [Trichonephila clavipes]
MLCGSYIHILELESRSGLVLVALVPVLRAVSPCRKAPRRMYMPGRIPYRHTYLAPGYRLIGIQNYANSSHVDPAIFINNSMQQSLRCAEKKFVKRRNGSTHFSVSLRLVVIGGTLLPSTSMAEE